MEPELENDLPFHLTVAEWATEKTGISVAKCPRVPTVGHFGVPATGAGAGEKAYFLDFSSRSRTAPSVTSALPDSPSHDLASSGSGDPTISDPDAPEHSDISSDWGTASVSLPSREQSPDLESPDIHSFCGSSSCLLCPIWSAPPLPQQLPEPAPCMHAFYDGHHWVHQLTLGPYSVSWAWNGSRPSGTVAEVKPGDVTVTSHRGNDITKTGTTQDPAVHSQYYHHISISMRCKANSRLPTVERSGNDVVKTVSELKVDQKGASQKEDGTWDNSNGASSSSNHAPSEPKKDEPKKDDTQIQNDTNGEAKAGDKRKADEQTTTNEPEKPAEEEQETKKQKTTNGTTSANEKKKPGRPKGANGAKKEKKVPRAGTAARKTRSQGKAE